MPSRKPFRPIRKKPIATACLLILAVAFSVSLAGARGNGRDRDPGDASQGLSAAQRQAVRTLNRRLRAREITGQQFQALRRQIRPARRLRAAVAENAAEREERNAFIAANGYDGREDCVAPPDYMLTAEIVPQTPIDPSERKRRRASTARQDDEARVEIEAWLAAEGADPSVGVRATRSDVDLWGRYHGRFQQTHLGVPLTKGSVSVRRTADGDLVMTDALVAGIQDIDVEPSIALGRAGELAVAAVDPAGAHGYVATPALWIEPSLENVLVDARDEGAASRHERHLRDARLVWQVLVAPDYTDFNTGFDAILAQSPVTFDGPDDPADRDENTLLGGREDDALSDGESWVFPTATPYRVKIDARSGEVLSTENLLTEDLDDLQAPPTIGTGLGYFNSRVDLDTTFWAPFDAYVLADFTRSKPGTANIVLHGKNLDTHDVADFDLFLDANNLWGNGQIDFLDPACLSCTTGQTPAVDVAFGVQRTYDLLRNVLGRDGTDDAGASQTAVAHWDVDYKDAHYNGASGLIAFGNGDSASKPGNYSIGTVAHEIGHAIWKKESVGTGGNPARGMNEGHGDFLGGLVDIYQDNTGGKGDWLYRIPWAGGSWRSRTLEPEDYDECETNNDIEVCEVGSPYWDIFVEMSPFEHVAGIPFTRAFMHLAEGSSDRSTSPYYTKFFPDTPMRGIGLNKAAAIWIHTVNHFLPASPKLAEARFAAYQAAEDLFGAGSDEAKATANAFAAVGMGLPADDVEPPRITYADVHTINLRTLTARTYGVARDDTGAEMVEPAGLARKNDAFLGYLDLSEWDVGYNSVTFRAVDSEGKEDTESRICFLPYRPQLLDDGGFEESSSDWNGADKVADEDGTLFGEKYLSVRTQSTHQALDLRTVTGAELSYWVAADKGLGLLDEMRVRVLDADLNPLAVLAEHTLEDDWFPRPARSNGYLNFRHDLSAWEGQEVVIAFEASRNGLFRVDHVVASFATVQLLPPAVQIFETDNSVFLTITEADFAPFAAMDLEPRIYVDGADVGPLVTTSGLQGMTYTALLAIDEIGLGAHFTQTIAVNENDQFVVAGQAEWFAPTPVSELLTNGRFEDGLDGWEVAGPGVALEDADDGFVFQGEHAVRLGDVGAVNEATISRNVSVPPNPKALKFTARVRREFSDANNDFEDQLVVDFLDQNDAVLDSAVLFDTAFVRLEHEPPSIFQTFVLTSYAPSAAKLAGKTVRVRLRTLEDDEGPSSFVVDNASLTYSDWGLQIQLGG